MALQPSIILGAQSPDILGAMSRGNALAQQTNQMRQQQQQNAFLQDNGQALLSGDQNALAQYAQFDPTGAFNMQTQNRNNARADEQLAFERQRLGVQDQRADQEWQMRVAEYKSGLSAEQAAAEAAQIEDAVKMGLSAQTPEQWDAMMAQQAPDLVGQFESRDALASRYMEVADILKGQAGPEFRQATPEEASAYGAQGGQFGPDGRFYPINPPSGLGIRTNPDGSTEIIQGSGVKFTEGQSKDNVYATRAEGALATLDPIAGELTSRTARAADMVPMGLARGAQSDEFQVAKNAGDEFLQAILRKDTGAAITEPEQALYGVTYLPQPGDGEAVLAQKQQARRRAVEALKSGMSPSQIIAQEKALAESGSPQLAPVDQGQPAQQSGAPDFSTMSDEELADWIEQNG